MGVEQIERISQFFIGKIVESVKINMPPSNGSTRFDCLDKLLFFVYILDFLDMPGHEQIIPTDDGTLDEILASIRYKLFAMG